MTPDWSVAEVQEFVPQGFDTMVRPPPLFPKQRNLDVAHVFQMYLMLSVLPRLWREVLLSVSLFLLLFTLRRLLVHGSCTMSRTSTRAGSSMANITGPALSLQACGSYPDPETDLNLQTTLPGNGNGNVSSTSPFDPFVTASNPLAAASAVGPVQANPFSPDTAAALGGATFFAGQSGFQQPVSLH